MFQFAISKMLHPRSVRNQLGTRSETWCIAHLVLVIRIRLTDHIGHPDNREPSLNTLFSHDFSRPRTLHFCAGVKDEPMGDEFKLRVVAGHNDKAVKQQRRSTR